jgi:hypothetical protein
MAKSFIVITRRLPAKGVAQKGSRWESSAEKTPVEKIATNNAKIPPYPEFQCN